MNKIVSLCIGLLYFPFLNAQEIEQITDDSIPFIYESRAQIPTTDDSLAEIISMEYRNAHNEFTKHELMEKIKPVLQSKLEQAKSTNSYLIRVGSHLGKYNFKRKSFPSGFTESTYIPFNNKYAVNFSNIQKFSEIAMSYDDAKLLTKSLDRHRNITAVIYLELTGAYEKKMNYRKRKVLKSYISKVEFLNDNGSLITTLKLTSSK